MPRDRAGRPAVLAAVVLALGAVGCGSSEDGGSASAPGGSTTTLLDGREKSLVVVGESTSYAWPRMLQEMLDAHADGERRYHVLNAAVGGAPVGRWIGDPEPGDRDETFGAMVRDFFGPDARLRGDAPIPTVALCQQTLQLTGSDRGPVASAEDVEGIRIGADAFERLAVELHDRGVERVYIGTHIYTEPVEPEVGNERLALAALLDRGHEFVYAGPDVWTATRDAHLDAFGEDGIHPSQLGMKIMAEQWYRILSGDDARQEVIDRVHATDYDIEMMMIDHINGRRR